MTDPMDELRQVSADLQQMESPIPPPELVREWIEPSGYKVIPPWLHELLQTAAQWGAEVELDACCERLTLTHGQWELAADLRAARRPKPPSFAEKALKAMGRYKTEEWCEELTHDGNIILRALKRLQELEEQQ